MIEIELSSMLLGFGLLDMGYILWVVIPGALLSGGAAWLVKSRFAKYSKVPTTRGYTGQMAASNH